VKFIAGKKNWESWACGFCGPRKNKESALVLVAWDPRDKTLQEKGNYGCWAARHTTAPRNDPPQSPKTAARNPKRRAIPVELNAGTPAPQPAPGAKRRRNKEHPCRGERDPGGRF